MMSNTIPSDLTATPIPPNRSFSNFSSPHVQSTDPFAKGLEAFAAKFPFFSSNNMKLTIVESDDFEDEEERIPSPFTSKRSSNTPSVPDEPNSKPFLIAPSLPEKEVSNSDKNNPSITFETRNGINQIDGPSNIQNVLEVPTQQQEKKKRKRRSLLLQSIYSDETVFEISENGEIALKDDIFSSKPFDLDLNFSFGSDTDFKTLSLPSIPEAPEFINLSKTSPHITGLEMNTSVANSSQTSSNLPPPPVSPRSDSIKTLLPPPSSKSLSTSPTHSIKSSMISSNSSSNSISATTHTTSVQIQMFANNMALPMKTSPLPSLSRKNSWKSPSTNNSVSDFLSSFSNNCSTSITSSFSSMKPFGTKKSLSSKGKSRSSQQNMMGRPLTEKELDFESLLEDTRDQTLKMSLSNDF